MEETAYLHISALGKYLDSHLVNEQAGVSNQRQSARDKLTRLTKQQFQELSTDVYDEMSRRVVNTPEVPFLQVRDDFHPKRNQARQKLATLPTVRFKDLASDVFFELERRYPNAESGKRQNDGYNISQNNGESFSEPHLYDDQYSKNNDQQYQYQSGSLSEKEPYINNQNQYIGQNQYPADKSGDIRSRDPYNPYQPAVSSAAFIPPPTNASAELYTQQPSPLQNSHPMSVPSPHVPHPITTIVAKQQTATVQRVAPGYTVQKNSYENSPPPNTYGYQENSTSGYGSDYVKTNEPQDTSFQYSTDSTEPFHAPQQDTPRGSEGHGESKSKSGFSIDQMISNSAAAAANVSGRDRNDVRLSTSSTGSRISSGGGQMNAPSENSNIGANGVDPLAGTVNFSSLDSLMADLGSMIRVSKSGAPTGGPLEVDDKVVSLGSVPPSSTTTTGSNETNMIKMKKDYEIRIDGLRRRVLELETQAADNPLVTKLEEEAAQLRAVNAQQMEDYQRLQEDFQELLENHKRLQETAETSRSETESLLSDLRELSRKYDELRFEKEKEQVQIAKLVDENAQLQKELEVAKHASISVKAMQPSPLVSAFSPRYVLSNSESILTPQEGGAIEPQRITAYQEAIDDLLRSGRSDVPTSVLMAMKAIVIACKAITEDIEAHEQRAGSNLSREDKEKLFTLKSKFSATLTNLMTAAKNHATGFGVSPVSLLDANAGNLTATVVEIVKLLRMKNVSISHRGSVDGGNRGRSGSSLSQRETTQRYSPMPPHVSSTPASSSVEHGSEGTESFEVDELKIYLERQTDSIVQAIQTLLHAMRQSSFGQELFDTITSITGIVDSLVSSSRLTFSRPSGSRYKARGEMILQDLESSNRKLSKLKNALEDANAGNTVTTPTTGKPSKQRLASASFEIAKYVKELVGLIE